jgi:hypothetical protein
MSSPAGQADLAADLRSDECVELHLHSPIRHHLMSSYAQEQLMLRQQEV